MAALVMTSGFGAGTARRLHDTGGRLILGARSPGGTVGESLPLDLASLDSVRGFAAAVQDRLGAEPIDALVLNAGIVRPDATGRSLDGHEVTFSVNHLAPYLLLRLLVAHLAPGAVVVLTTSGTHDPELKGGLAPPRHADARLLANPSGDAAAEPTSARAGQEAYTASKLCSVLTVGALADRAEIRQRDSTVLAYCPGQVFGTGLAAGLSRARRIAWRVMGTPVSAPVRRFVPTLNTREAAGAALARLALGEVTPPAGRSYVALRRGELTWPEPSALARSTDLAERLWRDSAALVGIDP